MPSSTSIAITDDGATTIGRAKRAWALSGTMQQRLDLRPHDRARPALKLYAVEPVGVAQTTPSQPHRDSGRLSISTTTSSIRSRAAFSTLASLTAKVA